MAAKKRDVPAEVEVTIDELAIIAAAAANQSVEQSARCATARYERDGVVTFTRLGDDNIYKSWVVSVPNKLMLTTTAE